MKRTLRVLMVEDSELDAELVVAELERAGQAVESLRVDSRETFTTALRDFLPDVVLCDHGLSSFNALSVLDLLRTHRPAVPLIVVSGLADERMTVSCLRGGAEDVIAKDHLDRLPGSIAVAIATRRPLENLTPRHLQVLRLIAEGHTTPEIARRLRLSTKTVETHRTELMRRVGIHDVVRLVRFAVRVGLVSWEG